MHIEQTAAEIPGKIEPVTKALSIDPKPKRNLLEKLATHPLTRKLIRRVTPYLVDTSLDLTEFDYTELDQFDQEVDPKKTKVVIVTSHFSHSEGATLVDLAKKVRRKFPFVEELVIPICQTLEDGRQGIVAQTMYREVGLPTFERNGISPLYVYTENDKTKRHAEPTSKEQRAILKSIQEAVQKDSTAIAVFAGGTVQPGRHKEDGTINGMGEVTDAFLPRVLQDSRRFDMQTLIIAVGVSSSFRILSAERVFPTRESALNLLKRRLGLPVDKLATVKVGRPFFLGSEVTKDNVNQFVIGENVTPLVKEEEQGFYREKPAVDAVVFDMSSLEKTGVGIANQIQIPQIPALTEGVSLFDTAVRPLQAGTPDLLKQIKRVDIYGTSDLPDSTAFAGLFSAKMLLAGVYHRFKGFHFMSKGESNLGYIANLFSGKKYRKIRVLARSVLDHLPTLEKYPDQVELVVIRDESTDSELKGIDLEKYPNLKIVPDARQGVSDLLPIVA